MAEIHKVICDCCGRDVAEGHRIAAARRRIHGGSSTQGAWKYDLCEDCYRRIVAECRRAAK